MDSLALILNAVALFGKFIPQGGGALGTIVTLVMQYGPAIASLAKAGTPVLSAVEQHSPELLAALKQFASAFTSQPSAADVETIAKAIFVPHMTTTEEAAWMDRASFNTGQ